MSRSFVLGLAAVLACGCGEKHPAAPAATAGPVAPAEQQQASSPVSAKPAAPTGASSPAAPASPPATNRFRELVSHYLDSDGNGGWRTNEKAATELEKLAPDEIAQLWPLLKDPQVEVRRGAAVFLLTQFNPAQSQQREAFSALLDDPDPMIRARSLDAIRQFARDDQIAALPRLGAMLAAAREPRAENRITIARLCGSLKADARSALPSLQQAGLSDADAKVRAAAVAAVANVAEPPESPDYLKKALEDKDSAVRLVAAARLRQLGPTAAPAVKELATALADLKTEVAEAAGEALIQIGAPAVNPLTEQLSSSSAAARKLALICLTKLGPAAKSAKSAVERCKQDSDPQVRQLAEAALKILSAP